MNILVEKQFEEIGLVKTIGLTSPTPNDALQINFYEIPLQQFPSSTQSDTDCKPTDTCRERQNGAI